MTETPMNDRQKIAHQRKVLEAHRNERSLRDYAEELGSSHESLRLWLAGEVLATTDTLYPLYVQHKNNKSETALGIISALLYMHMPELFPLAE